MTTPYYQDPYYQDDAVTLWHGNFREVLPTLGQFDACVADPPYAQTSLAWDRWPGGWPGVVAQYTQSLWCFGTFRMFLDRRDEFAAWKLSQDIVWRKTRPVGAAADRFRRQHELVTHWYQGAWAATRHEVPRVESGLPSRGTVRKSPEKADVYGASTARSWSDDGTRRTPSVIEAATESATARRYWGSAINPTQKPLGIIEPLIEYACPPGGLVLDPFAGSGSTGVAARNLGRRAVLIEAREEQCEATALRLSKPFQVGLDLGEVS